MTRCGWLLFAAVSILWGVPYLFIKLAVADLSPVVAWDRVAIGDPVPDTDPHSPQSVPGRG